ncbi:MAG: hypothetical protein JW797_11165 [Bradymonadales bacterium]|nr:hypothetical protein [Bradymonadales bacterium]
MNRHDDKGTAMHAPSLARCHLAVLLFGLTLQPLGCQVLHDVPASDRSDISDAEPIDQGPSDIPVSDPEIDDPDLPPTELPTDPDLVLDGTIDPGDWSPEIEDQSPFPTGTGTWEEPFVIDRFPFSDSRDTSLVDQAEVDAYSCAPTINESGAEVVYRLVLPSAGVLSVSVGDGSEQEIDVDIHLLSGPDPDACLVRHHYRFYHVVWPEEDLYLVVDTWVDSEGTALAGPYTLEVDLTDLFSGVCQMQQDPIDLINREEPLQLPAIGEVVREAHLVTTQEFPDGWPTSSREGLEDHYALSQSVSGYVMTRTSDWAPAGEGGCEYGQGSTVRPPVLDEAWYVNMYWRYRPAGGTRMLVYNPVNGRAVVTSAGYETGPGSNLRIGGACEEIHHYLGSTHGSRLLMGFLADQELPLGPIECDGDH